MDSIKLSHTLSQHFPSSQTHLIRAIMDLSLIADTFTVATKQGLSFTRLTTSEFLMISAAICPVDALAPPRPKRKTLTRTLLRKKRRTRKRHAGGGEEDGVDDVFFNGDGGGNFNGPFGGGYGGGGYGRWNFDGFSGNNWNNDDFSSNSWSGPAFNFVYEVLCWIALSNCVHFAFKKVVRILADRGKVVP